MATYTPQTYGGGVKTGSSSLGGIISTALGGGSSYRDDLSRQQAATNNQLAYTNKGYGIQSQQVGNDLAHTMRGYDIDAQNLQITSGTLARQQAQLDAMRGIAQRGNALDLANIALNRKEAQRGWNQQFNQDLRQAVASGAVNAAGNRQDRTSAREQLANQMQSFANDETKVGLDWDSYLQQFFGQKADLSDSQARLWQDVLALGNSKDAATTSAALQQAAIANNRAGANAGGGGGGGGGFNFGALGGSGSSPANPFAMPSAQQFADASTTLMKNLSNPGVYANIGNTKNPLGVSDNAWNQMIMLSVAQNGGVQNAQSLRNLESIMNMIRAAQAGQTNPTYDRQGFR